MAARKGYRAWTDDERATLRELTMAGYNAPYIAKTMNRSLSSIHKQTAQMQIGLHRMGIAMVRPVAGHISPDGPTAVEAFAPEASAEEPEDAFLARMLQRADRTIAKATAQRHARLRIASREPIAISLSSDWHVSPDGTDLTGLLSYADFVAATPRLYALGVGDLHDNPIKHKGGNIGGVMDELRLLDILVGRFHGKLLGFTSGNHDDWSKTLAGVDNLLALARRHRIHYAPDELLWQVEIVDPDDAETVTASYRIHTRHQWRRGSALNPCHACWTWWQEEGMNWDGHPDVLAIGHNHVSVVESRQFAERDVWALRMGTWQIDSAFARAKGFGRYRSTAPTVVLPASREAGRVQAFADPQAAVQFMNGEQPRAA